MFARILRLIFIRFRQCSLASLFVTLESTVPDTPVAYQEFTEFLYDLFNGITNITVGTTVLPLREINVLNPSDESLQLNITASTSLCTMFESLHSNNNYTCPFNETLPSPLIPACFNAVAPDTSTHDINIIFNSSETVLTSTLQLAVLYTLQDYFNNNTEGCANLTITNISVSDLSVHLSMMVKSGDITQTSLASALLNLARLNEILNIRGNPTPVRQIRIIKPDGSVLTVNPASNLCTVFEQVKSCESNFVCINRNNKASCLMSDTGDDLAVIIGLGVGVPVILLVMALLTLMIIYARRLKKRRYRRYQRSPEYSVFTTAIIPKFHSVGRQPYQHPDQWMDTESLSSVSSSPKSTRRLDDDTYPKGPASSPFYLSSWDIVHNTGDEFKIRRPKIRQTPDEVYVRS
ncbi:uncharacterized protein LOC132543694 [Ylistrum balloti]|uniref:uncharacterized protein LOC132543694 n=1 Tax=Ylistrum balloti TaxID=509963 RepID=UPI002905A69D|nr:uncharacterized protein LOC132543694 [Ylistrum balloti]